MKYVYRWVGLHNAYEVVIHPHGLHVCWFEDVDKARAYVDKMNKQARGRR